MTLAKKTFTVGLLCASLLSVAIAGESNHSHLENEDDSDGAREQASTRLYWRDSAIDTHANPASWIRVKILGINDFHGQLSAGRRVGQRPVGSAPVLAAYLKAAEAKAKDGAFIVHAGDHVGATPPNSALLQDEPSIQLLNLLANQECKYEHRLAKQCNIVGTLGNHEFDEGAAEMLRLINGGNHANGPFLEDPYLGARFPYVSANVVDRQTRQPILPPYVIKRVRGIPIAFIGAVLKETPSIVTPTGVAGVEFLDEAASINKYIPELRNKHVRAIVVLIHQGTRQASYAGPTDEIPNQNLSGSIADIVKQLDSDVDVVVSGHAHSFTNALIENVHGKSILLTQSFSSGTAFGDIDIAIDPASRDIVEKSAVIVTTYADVPDLALDPAIVRLVAAADATVAPLVSRVMGIAANAITKTQNSAGESALGNLIADAQRAAMGSDIAFMNPGGIRADIDAGNVTWGELFTVQPFNNDLVKMTLTGTQIVQLLEQQWQNQPFPRLLSTSGLNYSWDNNRPIGNRVVSVQLANGNALDLNAIYSVTVNSFIAAGGDNFTLLAQGTNRVVGPVDLDALSHYVSSQTQPFSASIEGRIVRIN